MSVIPDSHRDLADARTAVFATIGPDGRPQLSAVWFLIEGDTIRLSLNTTRQKTRNLEARPVGTLFVLDPSGTRYLELRGDVSLEPDPDYAFADLVGAKYGGVDLREMDGEGEGRVVVTLTPTRVNAVDITAG
jgi:PPOX class probable F420-dependent enzyme